MLGTPLPLPAAVEAPAAAFRALLCSKACRRAVKFGDALAPLEQRWLIRDLADCALPFQCAHGRPTLYPLLDELPRSASWADPPPPLLALDVLAKG